MSVKLNYFISSHKKVINYDIRIKINGKRLMPSKYVKYYLGILIDSQLNWDHQINLFSGKLSRANGMLSKIRHYVPNNIIYSMYYAIFSSLMTFSSIVWGQVLNFNNNRISILQNKALRTITFSSRDSCNPIYCTSIQKY